jgi:hypothetical protein
MKTSEFIKAVHREYQGDTDYPVPNGSDGQYELYLGTANDQLEIFGTDPDNKWRSRWEERTFGTVTTERTYGLGNEVWSLSDYVYIDKLNGGTARFEIVDPQQREDVDNAVYISGENPQVMTFTGSGSMADDLVGGTIRAGCFIKPKPLTIPAQYVPVLRPMWLVYVTAATLSRNDNAKEHQYANLVGLANDEWGKMVSANRQTLPGQSRRVRHTVSRMGRRY